MSVPTILLIGKNGQLGWELQRTCTTLGPVVAVDYPEIDLVRKDALRKLIREVKPNLIINAAAYTNVDKAESEPELARKVNAIAPGIMAEEAKRLDSVFVHYSTDYIFDGEKGSPYTEIDTPNPTNVYGATKLEGEQNIQAVYGANLIFRTSWVYSLRQGGFVNKVLRWASEQEELRIVDDQISSPTWARMLAEATAQVIAKGNESLLDYVNETRGLYHLSGGGACSRYEWAQLIFKLSLDNETRKAVVIRPAKSAEFPTPAKRPAYTALMCDLFQKVFNLSLPDWRSTLGQALH